MKCQTLSDPMDCSLQSSSVHGVFQARVLEWGATAFSRGHCWIFQICYHIECSTFTSLSFRIWNSSTGTPSPPLALFVVMLHKAHLTSHSRMSGSRWVITPSWLSGSWRSFLYSSSVYSWLPLLNIFCFCLVHTISVLFCTHLFMKCSLCISNFLEEISSLSHSIVSSNSLHWSLRKAFLSLLDIVWSSAFTWVYLSFSPLPLAFLFSSICNASSDNHCALLHFFFLEMVLITASCTMLWTSVHSSSGTLAHLIPSI